MSLRAAAIVVLVAVASMVGYAEVGAQTAPAGARRLALVIGNEAYLSSKLRNPVNDARAMSTALREAGFDVDLVTDANLRQMNGAIDAFIAKVKPGDAALFFFAGHGIQIEGENYLVPTDFAAQDEADARYMSYSASRILDRMTATGARMKVLVLDACRNNPFRVSRALSGGLATMASSGRGSLIAFAAGPGGTADDNVSGSNGLFTSELLKTIREPGLDIEQVFARVRASVDELSAGRQTPWTNSSLIGSFYFHPAAGAPAPAAATAALIAPSPLAVVQGADLNKAYNWAASPIDFKAPGAEAAARAEISDAIRRTLAPTGVGAALYGESGIIWVGGGVNMTGYVSGVWKPAVSGKPAAPKPPVAVRFAYISSDTIIAASRYAQTLKSQTYSGGASADQKAAADEAFRTAVSRTLEPIARAHGVPLIFNNNGTFAFADERLDLSREVIAALDSGTPPAAPAPLQLAAGEMPVRWVDLQQVAARSRLGQRFKAQMQAAVARKAPQSEITELQNKLLTDFQAALTPVIDRAATAAHLSMVLSASDAQLAWSDPRLNLTDTIVRDLDAAVQ